MQQVLVRLANKSYILIHTSLAHKIHYYTATLCQLVKSSVLTYQFVIHPQFGKTLPDVTEKNMP